MRKNTIILFIGLLIISLFIYFIYSSNHKEITTLKQHRSKDVHRIILDSFIISNTENFLKVSSTVYRVSNCSDTVYFLTENNDVYKVYQNKLLDKFSLKDVGEFWYFSICRNDTIIFNVKKNTIRLNNKIKQTLSDKIIGMAKIDDTNFVVSATKESQNFLSFYNLNTNNITNDYNLYTNLGFLDSDYQAKSISSQISEGMFCETKKSILYLIFRAGNFIVYDKLSKKFNLHSTIDSIPFSKIVSKKIPYKDTIVEMPNLQDDDFLNYSITASDSSIFILSNAGRQNNCNYIDVYDIKTYKYLHSIKVIKDKDGAEAFEIKFVNKNMYILYNNEKIFFR